MFIRRGRRILSLLVGLGLVLGMWPFSDISKLIKNEAVAHAQSTGELGISQLSEPNQGLVLNWWVSAQQVISEEIISGGGVGGGGGAATVYRWKVKEFDIKAAAVAAVSYSIDNIGTSVNTGTHTFTGNVTISENDPLKSSDDLRRAYQSPGLLLRFDYINRTPNSYSAATQNPSAQLFVETKDQNGNRISIAQSRAIALNNIPVCDKVADYINSKKLGATGVDGQLISRFETYITNICTSGKPENDALLSFINSPTTDPFNAPEGLITSTDLSSIRAQFQDYSGTESAFADQRLKFQREVNKFLNDFGYTPGSCMETVLAIKNSVSEQTLRGNLLFRIVIADAPVEFLAGPVGIAAGVGAFIGTTIGGTITGALLDQAAQELGPGGVRFEDFVKRELLLKYKLLYLQLAEAKVGLDKFQSEGTSLPYGTGLNPTKLSQLDGTLTNLEKSWQSCKDALGTLVQDINQTLGTNDKTCDQFKGNFIGIRFPNLGSILCEAGFSIASTAAQFAAWAFQLLLSAAGLQ